MNKPTHTVGRPRALKQTLARRDALLQCAKSHSSDIVPPASVYLLDGETSLKLSLTGIIMNKG